MRPLSVAWLPDPEHHGGALEPDTSRPRHRQRAAQPEEIGRLAVFLASSDGDYVTGATYVMDGGLMQMAGQGA